MFIAKVVAQTRFFWNGQSQNGKKGMVSFEVTGLNIIREHCGMVSNKKAISEIHLLFKTFYVYIFNFLITVVVRAH